MVSQTGSTVASIGERRGLGKQQAKIDRRHAQLLFNEVAYFFQSGWQFDLGPVFTPVNSFWTKARPGYYLAAPMQRHRRGQLGIATGLLLHLTASICRIMALRTVARFIL